MTSPPPPAPAGVQDLGFRNEIDVLFDVQPGFDVTLHVADEKGNPTTGTFEIRDAFGRVYPAQVGAPR